MELDNPSNSTQIEYAISQAYLPESNHKELHNFLLRSLSVLSNVSEKQKIKTNTQLAVEHLERKLDSVGKTSNKIQLAVLIVLVLTLIATACTPLMTGGQ